jgi:hypothetical protein
MVVDRPRVKTGSESRRYRVAGKLEVRAGRRVRSPENRQVSKPGGLAKERIAKQEHGKNTLVDLKQTI